MALLPLALGIGTGAQLHQPLAATPYPEAPVYLPEDVRAEWLLITTDYPADHFSVAQLPMLEAYCRHRIALRNIGQMIDDMIAVAEAVEDGEAEVDDEDAPSLLRYDQLLKMQERETRCLASLAVRLGFAHTTKTGADGAKKRRSPWG